MITTSNQTSFNKSRVSRSYFALIKRIDRSESTVQQRKLDSLIIEQQASHVGVSWIDT